MKILVTGGAGFIGSHVVDLFIREDYEVVIVDDLSTGKKENLNPEARFYQLDIRDPGLEEIFRMERPDYVNHQAAQIDVRRSVSDPIFDAGVNILGTINLLQNCIKYKVKKVIFASSGGAIYGEQEIFPAPEDHPLRPVSPYGITKLVGEYYLRYYKNIYGLDYVSLRYANVYGPRQDPFGEAGVVAIFIQRMLDGGQPVINGDGEQTRDFVYVEDVARANLLALKNNTGEDVFNIGTGVETSVNQIFHILRGILHIDIKELHGPPKKGEQRRSVIDPSRARDMLGWRPHVDLMEGLGLTANFFKVLS